MDPIDISYVREQLSNLRTRSKHALGQNFLIDESVREKILLSAAVTPGERIIEIGPGLGVLTGKLLEAGVNLTAFELDPIMVQFANTTFGKVGNLTVIEGDAVRTLPEYARDSLQGSSYAVVANIPYQITTPLLERLFIDPRGFERPSRAVLLIQNEVADRLSAKPSDHARGAMSVLLQMKATVEKIVVVPPSAFFPSPKVTSAVIKVVPRVSAVPDEQWMAFAKFVRGAFQQRRKQLKNVLAGMLGVSVKDVDCLFKTLNISTTARAQELTEAEWLALFRARQNV